MAKLPKERESEINLEDLLRLKRSERPSDQFWNEFDSELHQRMLQTLVKKDPWYLQVMRGFSGRMMQSTAVAAAAVLVAMFVVRPAFQPVTMPTSVAVATMPVPVTELVAMTAPVVEVAVEAVPLAEVMTPAATPNYQADAISVKEATSDAAFVRDFGMESMQVASYDASAYSTDAPHERVSFASAGMASLVY